MDSSPDKRGREDDARAFARCDAGDGIAVAGRRRSPASSASGDRHLSPHRHPRPDVFASTPQRLLGRCSTAPSEHRLPRTRCRSKSGIPALTSWTCGSAATSSTLLVRVRGRSKHRRTLGSMNTCGRQIAPVAVCVTRTAVSRTPRHKGSRRRKAHAALRQIWGRGVERRQGSMTRRRRPSGGMVRATHTAREPGNGGKRSRRPRCPPGRAARSPLPSIPGPPCSLARRTCRLLRRSARGTGSSSGTRWSGRGPGPRPASHRWKPVPASGARARQQIQHGRLAEPECHEPPELAIGYLEVDVLQGKEGFVVIDVGVRDVVEGDGRHKAPHMTGAPASKQRRRAEGACRLALCAQGVALLVHLQQIFVEGLVLTALDERIERRFAAMATSR